MKDGRDKQSTGRMQGAWLPGRRLHLSDGPIDLVIGCDGSEAACRQAFATAAARFEGLLDELCRELPLLRAPPGDVAPKGPVARRMWNAVLPFASTTFITPMAAVAGAVAEEVLAAMVTTASDAAPLLRAFVNDGGDIALHLTPGTDYRIGLVDRPDQPALFGRTVVGSGDPIRGIATSGWRGRSLSLGIADAVTVLAPTAAIADATATLIANAVNLPSHPAVTRAPARDLQPDSDLGHRLVTRDVGRLSSSEITVALAAGAALAETIAGRGLISAAALRLCGVTRIVGASPLTLPVAPQSGAVEEAARHA